MSSSKCILFVATLFVASTIAACSDTPHATPPAPSTTRTYLVSMVGGDVDTVTDATEVRLKRGPTGAIISIRGRGFERTYKEQSVTSVVDRDRNNVDVRQTMKSASAIIDCPPPVLAHDRKVQNLPNCGPLFEFTACIDGPCGDDGSGGMFGVGLVINRPGYYCYYDFPNDLPDCYDNAAAAPPPRSGQDLYLRWDRTPASVTITCSNGGASGREFAHYTDGRTSGIHTGRFTYGVAREIQYPAHFNGTLPPGPVSTIESNFYQYGIPMPAFYVGWCNHTG